MARRNLIKILKHQWAALGKQGQTQQLSTAKIKTDE
jgi:hypothetical protein